MLKKYIKGVVPEAEQRTIGGTKSGATSASSDSGSSLVWIAYAIPAVAVLLAVLYQYGFLAAYIPSARK